jgi:hypothetical protein
MSKIVLPELVWKQSPNRSSRHGVRVDLLVWHETAGPYAGSVAWLRNPKAEASAHLVIDEHGEQAAQLVARHEKAWHASHYNARSVGVEHANVTAKGYASEQQLRVSARVFGWLCLHEGVPPRWARGGQGRGVCYHGELGALGGGHTQCGPALPAWHRFLEYLHAELERGGYRREWAR